MGAAEDIRSFEARRRVVGSRLGRYSVGPRLGVGGSASVYLARLDGPANSERLVSLKVVHEHLSEEGDFIGQFMDEANLLVRLAHPNIVEVYELGRDGNALYLAMEYLHGQPLSRILSAIGRRGERLPPDLVAWIGARVAEGLAYAHQARDDSGKPLGLVHRDVSPQNVFVTYDGTIKIIDFGIARAAGRIAQTTLGRVKGKFSYMAPEQVLGRDFDHRADLFALGATLYEAAVGARLFAGMDEAETLHKLLLEEVPDPCRRLPGFPAELARILKRTLESDPDNRYRTGTELAAALDGYVRAAQGGDPARRLSELLADAFASERAEQEQAIDDLRALTAETAPNNAVTMRAPPAPAGSGSRSVAVFIGIALLLVGLSTSALLIAKRTPTPSPTSTASVTPLPATVVIEVTVQPEVDSEITVGGTRVLERPARLVRDRNAEPLEVTVAAAGYETAKLSVVPDRDRSVVVPLVRVAQVAEPAPPEKKKIRGGGVPQKKKDPLVTEYPR